MTAPTATTTVDSGTGTDTGTGTTATVDGGEGASSGGLAPTGTTATAKPRPPAGAATRRDPTERVRTSSRDDNTPDTGSTAGTGEAATTAGTAAGTTTEPGQAPESTDWKVDDLPQGAQDLIKELRKENGARRAEASKATKAAQDATDKFSTGVEAFMKALGLTPEGNEEPVDPEKALGEVTELYREKTVELAVFRKAAGLGADPDALLDSRGFLTRAFAMDPAADGFDTDIATAITEALEANPKLRAAPEEPARVAPSGGEFGGGPADRTTGEFTVDDLRKERRKTRADGYAA